MIFLTLLALAVIFGLNFSLKKRDLLYPGTIQSCIWIFVFFLYSVFSEKFHKIDTTVFVVVVLSCVVFSLGCLFASGSEVRSIPLPKSSGQQESNDKITFFLTLLAILSLCLIVFRAHQIIRGEYSATSYFFLRHTINYMDKADGFGVLRYLFTFTYFSSFYVILVRTFDGRKFFSKKLAIMIVIGLIVAIISTSRTQLLSLFLLIGLPLYYFRKLNIYFFILILLFAFLPMFFLIGFTLGKFSFSYQAAGDVFSMYFLAPIVAFSSQLDLTRSFAFGENTFRFIYAVLDKIGIGPSPQPWIQRFSYVPMPTNLYTSFLPYYLDFGIAGILVIKFVLGLFHGYLYKLISKKNVTIFSIYLYLISLLPLFSVYTTETHFLQLSLWIQYLLFGFIFIKILPKLVAGKIYLNE